MIAALLQVTARTPPMLAVNGVLAAATTNQPDAAGQGFQIDVVALFQNGALVATIVCLLAGLLWTKPAYDRVVREAERATAQRDELLDVYQEKVIPTLATAIALLETVKPLVANNTEVLRRVEELLRDIKRDER